MDSNHVQILKEPEIIEFLRELGIDLKNNKAIHTPDSAFATDVLSLCATKCLLIKREELNNVNFECIRKINNEGQTDGIQLFNRFKIIQKLMSLINVQDFTLVDLIEPQGKRFKYLLTCIRNYMKYREQELNNFKDTLDRNKELEASAKKDQNELSKIKEEHDKLLERKQKESEMINEKKNRINLINNEITAIEEAAQKMDEEYQFLVQEEAKNRALIKDIIANMESLKIEIQNLRAQKVNSPQKIKDKCIESTNLIKIEKESISKLDEEINHFNFKIDQYSVFQNKLQKIFGLMNELKININREKIMRKELKELKKKITGLKDQNNEKLKESNDILKNRETLQERNEKLDVQIQKRMEQINSTIKEIVEIQNKFINDNSEAKSNLKEFEKFKVELESKLAETRRNQENLISVSLNIYGELLKNVNSFHEDIYLLLDSNQENSDN